MFVTMIIVIILRNIYIQDKLYKDYEPLKFFSFIAFVLFIISTIFFVPIVIEFLNTHLVPKFPTLIICAFVYISAIISFFTGLILDTVKN